MLKLRDILASGHGGRSREWVVFQRSQALLQNGTLDAIPRHAFCSTLGSNFGQVCRASRGSPGSCPDTTYSIGCFAEVASCSLLFLQNESLNSRNGHFIPLPPSSSTASHHLVSVCFQPTSTGLEHQVLTLQPQLLLHPWKEWGREGIESIEAQGCVMYKIGAQWMLQRRSKYGLSVRIHSFNYPLRGGGAQTNMKTRGECREMQRFWRWWLFRQTEAWGISSDLLPVFIEPQS